MATNVIFDVTEKVLYVVGGYKDAQDLIEKLLGEGQELHKFGKKADGSPRYQKTVRSCDYGCTVDKGIYWDMLVCIPGENDGFSVVLKRPQKPVKPVVKKPRPKNPHFNQAYDLDDDETQEILNKVRSGKGEKPKAELPAE